MKRQIMCFGIAALLAGSVGLACATPVIINGNFSQTDTDSSTAGNQAQTAPAEIDDSDQDPSGNVSYDGGQFVVGWEADGYALWFPNESAAENTNALGTWQGSGKEKLYPTVTDTPPTDSTSFVGLDGDQDDAGVQASIKQQVTGLTPGATYNVSFYWAAGQLQSRSGDTTSSLLVSLGGTSHSTGFQSNPSGSFSGWWSASMNFKAVSASEWLTFLAVGNPAGLPPMSLLAGVSMHKVPEPSELSLIGLALFGFGLLTFMARQRALRRKTNKGDDLA